MRKDGLIHSGRPSQEGGWARFAELLRPGEYFLSRGLLELGRTRGNVPLGTGDTARNAGLLEDGLRFQLEHPFHRRLFDDRVRAAIVRRLAQSISDASERSYLRIEGMLGTRHAEDRHVGPESPGRLWFRFRLDLLDSAGTDAFRGWAIYRPRIGDFALRQVRLERHEVRTEFARVRCAVCDLEARVRALESELPSLAEQFECPVCSFRDARGGAASFRERFESKIPDVDLQDLVRHPERYHLRKVRTRGILDLGLERALLFDGQDSEDPRIWPALGSACRQEARRMFETGSGAIVSPAQRTVEIEGIFKHAASGLLDRIDRRWRSAGADPSFLGPVLLQRGFGRMRVAEAEIFITRMTRQEE